MKFPRQAKCVLFLVGSTTNHATGLDAETFDRFKKVGAVLEGAGNEVSPGKMIDTEGAEWLRGTVSPVIRSDAKTIERSEYDHLSSMISELRAEIASYKEEAASNNEQAAFNKEETSELRAEIAIYKEEAASNKEQAAFNKEETSELRAEIAIYKEEAAFHMEELAKVKVYRSTIDEAMAGVAEEVFMSHHINETILELLKETNSGPPRTPYEPPSQGPGNHTDQLNVKELSFLPKGEWCRHSWIGFPGLTYSFDYKFTLYKWYGGSQSCWDNCAHGVPAYDNTWYWVTDGEIIFWAVCAY